MNHFSYKAFFLPLIFMGVGVVSAEELQQKYNGYEMPQYASVKSYGNIELRNYTGMLIAEVTVMGEREKAINEGFMILARYIFGNNVSKEKVSMTTPVTQRKMNEKIDMTTPVVQSGSSDQWKIQFMMPSKYTLATLPTTNDTRIQFRNTLPVKTVVIKFSGFINKPNLQKHLKELEDFIQQNSLTVQQPPQYAFYDAPWTLPFMRRNEISFILIESEKERKRIRGDIK